MVTKTFNPRLEESQQGPAGILARKSNQTGDFPGIDRRAFLMRSALVAA
jgi:hypothetical protein